MAGTPLVPVAVLAAGVYLAWFGVHYWGSDTRWPTDPVKDVLQGKPLPVPSGQESADAIAADVESGASASASTGASAGAAPSVPGAYTIAELEALWTSQGGSPATAFEAANIAMAESSGRPAVTSGNPGDGGTNVGLWQLDTKGVGSGYTVEQLQDPATNARITIMHTANGTVWTYWADSVVHNGVYTGPKV